MTKPNEDILSPEGIEERLKREVTLQITLTQGGKYRIYGIINGDRKTINLCDTYEDAQVRMGEAAILLGSLLRDPKGTIETLVRCMSEGKS